MSGEHFRGWIGVDFDGTLAKYEHWISAAHVGEPIMPMVELVKHWLRKGIEVRVFTARVFPFTHVITHDDPLTITAHMGPRHIEARAAAEAIRTFCREHIGHALPITCVKDYGAIEIYDDRAVTIEANTGRPLAPSSRNLIP